jgi:hypothetical protein
VRYSINSEKVVEFEVLENEAQKNKVANAYKTTLSKGRIYMSYKEDMLVMTAVKKLGAKYMQTLLVWGLKPRQYLLSKNFPLEGPTNSVQVAQSVNKMYLYMLFD